MTTDERLEMFADCLQAVRDLRREPKISALGRFLLTFLEGALRRLEAEEEGEESTKSI